MFSVIFVDDEQLIREGLAKNIPWKDLNLNLSGIASNGKEALLLAKKIHPDIVITDIRMPFLDGLELIEKIRDLNYRCKFIVISGYEEFDYALKAINLGVSAFIIKPIEIDIFCKNLSQIVSQLSKEANLSNEIQQMKVYIQQTNQYKAQQLLLKYYTCHLPKSQFLNQIPAELKKNKYYQLILVEINHFDLTTENMDEEAIFDLTNSFEKSLITLGAGLTEILINKSIGIYYILFSENELQLLEHFVGLFFKRLRIINFNLEYTTISAPIYESIENTIEAYNLLSKCSDFIFFWGKNKDIKYTEIENPSDSQIISEININYLVQLISSLDKEKILRELNSLSMKIKQGDIIVSYMEIRMLVNVLFSETLKILEDINCSLPQTVFSSSTTYNRIFSQTTLDGMIEELEKFLAFVCDYSKKTTDSYIIDKAKYYINKHFSDSNLTLAQISKELKISPNYFSALFNKKTGCLFIDYLTSIRLSNAKKYILNGNLKTYEIAQKCGYANPTYFSTIFKRHFGISPSDYYQKEINTTQS